MDYKELLLRAKENDARALEEFTAIYKPLLLKEAIIDGVFDNNLYQELLFLNHKINIRYRTY